MSLIISTYEERRANDKKRMDIINNVMSIQGTKNLQILDTMSRQFYSDEIRDIPLRLNEFVDLLELPLLIRLMDIFQNEPSNLMVNGQIKELLNNAIETYTGIEDKEETA